MSQSIAKTLSLGLLLSCAALCGRSQEGVTSDLTLVRPAPPFPALYQCVWNLKTSGHPDTDSESCLRVILATHFFLTGKVDRTVLAGGGVDYSFKLTAPEAVTRHLVTEVDQRGPE